MTTLVINLAVWHKCEILTSPYCLGKVLFVTHFIYVDQLREVN